MRAQPPVMPVWPGDPPGSEGRHREDQESFTPPPNGIRVIRNVARPTLTAYLPDTAGATGTAVVVYPGGAFHFLAIEHEGVEVARWLNERGIAAFVLRYRLIETAESDEEFHQQLADNMSDRGRMRALMDRAVPLCIADGQQAIRVVRRQAAALSLRSDRIGIMGFSAGGVVTTGAAASYDAESRPDFAAPIYSAHLDFGAVPEDAPPLFIALASDDAMAVGASIPLYSAWNAAGRSAELHIYAQGGHGFGMFRHGVPSDAWIERFGEWLAAQGM